MKIEMSYSIRMNVDADIIYKLIVTIPKRITHLHLEIMLIIKKKKSTNQGNPSIITMSLTDMRKW